MHASRKATGARHTGRWTALATSWAGQCLMRSHALPWLDGTEHGHLLSCRGARVSSECRLAAPQRARHPQAQAASRAVRGQSGAVLTMLPVSGAGLIGRVCLPVLDVAWAVCWAKVLGRRLGRRGCPAQRERSGRPAGQKPEACALPEAARQRAAVCRGRTRCLDWAGTGPRPARAQAGTGCCCECTAGEAALLSSRLPCTRPTGTLRCARGARAGPLQQHKAVPGAWRGPCSRRRRRDQGLVWPGPGQQPHSALPVHGQLAARALWQLTAWRACLADPLLAGCGGVGHSVQAIQARAHLHTLLHGLRGGRLSALGRAALAGAVQAEAKHAGHVAVALLGRPQARVRHQ